MKGGGEGDDAFDCLRHKLKNNTIYGKIMCVMMFLAEHDKSYAKFEYIGNPNDDDAINYRDLFGQWVYKPSTYYTIRGQNFLNLINNFWIFVKTQYNSTVSEKDKKCGERDDARSLISAIGHSNQSILKANAAARGKSPRPPPSIGEPEHEFVLEPEPEPEHAPELVPEPEFGLEPEPEPAPVFAQGASKPPPPTNPRPVFAQGESAISPTATPPQAPYPGSGQGAPATKPPPPLAPYPGSGQGAPPRPPLPPRPGSGQGAPPRPPPPPPRGGRASLNRRKQKKSSKTRSSNSKRRR